ncbi:hypothetical protein OF83DRAFT_1142553 [Amylostereum chailletii]|nr:hypothetical protein OF83DRAFT_1142553 [Amylostereum chailletii]
MAPKKNQKQKMSLNEFLGDDTLGSWADEMDALPTAPAARGDDDQGGSGRRDDYMSSRGDRQAFPPREDLPLPTQPPYTAFIGNMAFDLTEADLEGFFSGLTVKSAKVIKDRDDRPKGFGYVEFGELDDLKKALEKSGDSLSGRTIRVSVAEPPKERSGFGGGGFGGDDAKFASDWRRTGPLPDLPGDGSRESSRRRYDSGAGERGPPPSSLADNASEWRSSRPARGPPPGPEPRRPGFFAEGATTGAADREETWSKGSKFRPSEPSEERRSGSGFRGRGDMGPPADTPPAASDTGDWRTSSRPMSSRGSTSPSGSTPPTPQLTRRKLELLPRSGAPSVAPSPLASPKMPSSATSAPRTSPFGAAKPVDVTAKEKAVTERLEKEREATKDRLVQHPMSRNSSRAGSQRGQTRSPPMASVPPSPVAAANVRPTFSFAAAAGVKQSPPEAVKKDVKVGEKVEDGATKVTEQLGEVTI